MKPQIKRTSLRSQIVTGSRKKMGGIEGRSVNKQEMAEDN